MARFFTLKELCESSTAKARSIDNYPTFEVAAHLSELTEKILDPLRFAWGSPIRVNSGYRCRLLNTAVGGAERSAHMDGYAADLSAMNGKTEELISFAMEWIDHGGRKYDQIIREKRGNSTWLHIGLYGPNRIQRCQKLNIIK
jgi:putative chitinase